MTLKKLLTAVIVLIAFATTTQAQKVYYSQPDMEDFSKVNFDITGKIGQNIFIFKSSVNSEVNAARNREAIYGTNYEIQVYDEEMHLVNRVKLPMPGKVLSANTLAYKTFFYLFYQYLQDNTVYCMAAKFKQDGSLEGAPVVVDNTLVTVIDNNATMPLATANTEILYNIINSDDKSKIALYRLSRGNEDVYGATTVLFDSSLNLIKKSFLDFHGAHISNSLANFTLANNGTLIFLKLPYESKTLSSPAISIILKAPATDTVEYHYFNMAALNLRNIYLKIDNVNSRFLLAGFNATKNKGDIDGMFTSIWALNNTEELYHNVTPLSQQFRDSARGEHASRRGLNNYLIEDIVSRTDGGFVVLSESLEIVAANLSATTATSASAAAYYSYAYDYFDNYQFFYTPMTDQPGGYGQRMRSFNANDNFSRNPNYLITRDNIAAMSFTKSGDIEWAKVINKTLPQKDAESFNGYSCINMGDKLTFLFNRRDKGRMILYSSTITGDGNVSDILPLHNLNFDYSLMPRYAEQITASELVVPFVYKKHICFAHVVF